MVLLCDKRYSRRSWSSRGTQRPSTGGGVGRRVLPSMGTGADRALSDVAPKVFGAGVPGEETTSSVGASISPVHATTV